MYRYNTHSFVDVSVLKLNKSGADCSDVTLLVGEGHPTSTLNGKYSCYYTNCGDVDLNNSSPILILVMSQFDRGR